MGPNARHDQGDSDTEKHHTRNRKHGRNGESEAQDEEDHANKSRRCVHENVHGAAAQFAKAHTGQPSNDCADMNRASARVPTG